MLKTAFENSFQAKFLIPMAVTLTFGLIFATALTLILVPCLNLIRDDVMTNVLRQSSGSVPADDDLPADRSQHQERMPGSV